ncbi:MAG: hypothetical protein HYZ58_10120 [Acidobacteria bacterium]|nr:hypothetical protein [Acidobacteriota bacterium]
MTRLTLALLLIVAISSSGQAADKTFTGKIVCAQCTLQKPDAHECQDVLVVTDSKGVATEYYVVKNDVAKAAGEACTAEVPATVTGSVSEKDGKKWIAATKIEKR